MFLWHNDATFLIIEFIGNIYLHFSYTSQSFLYVITLNLINSKTYKVLL